MSWGFATLDVDHLAAYIRPGNAPSVKVAERLGCTPRRDEAVFGNPVTVHAVDRL